jgi:hypothetical protein
VRPNRSTSALAAAAAFGLTSLIAAAACTSSHTTRPTARATSSTPLTSTPATPACATSHSASDSESRHAMQVTLTIAGGQSDGRRATATLADTPTARDFASQLPLTLDMHDLLSREKPGTLPRPLHPTGEGKATYEAGDLGYWSPNHDLAIFYRHDGQTIPDPGIVHLGRMQTGLDAIAEAGDSFRLTIDRTQ